MRYFLGLLFCIAALGQSIVPGSITATDVSHSSMLLHFSITSDWKNVRIRYIRTADGSCTSGTGGEVMSSTYPDYDEGAWRPLNFQIILSGMQYPDTDYQVCPEVGSTGVDRDGTGTYSSGQGIVVHTAPLPAVHPALPVPPVEYHPTLPDMSSYHNVYLDNDCLVASGGPVGQLLGTTLEDAANHQAEYGTHIFGLPGARCWQQAQFNTNSQNVTEFNPSQVNMSDSSITFTSGQIANMMAPQGGTINEGQGLKFSTHYSNLPGKGPGDWPTQEAPLKCTGIAQGTIYYAHLPTPSDHTRIQLTCEAPYGQNAVDGTPYKLMVFANAGGGDQNRLKVQKYPTGLNWIVMDVNLPDSQFAEVNTRLSPEWASKMPGLVQPFLGSNYTSARVGNTPSNSIPMALTTASNDGNEGRTISNFWIRRWLFTVNDDIDSNTSTNPQKLEHIFATTRNSSDIVLDQVYFHGLGGPHRIHRTIASFDGHNMAMINSRFDNMEIFASNFENLQVSQLSPTSFKINKGYHGLNAKGKYIQPNDITVTLSTASSTGDFYISASLDTVTLNIALPPGVTGSCSGGPCNIFTTLDGSVGSANGSYKMGAHGVPNLTASSSPPWVAPLFWVDPIFNTTSTTVGADSLMADVVDPSKADPSASPGFYSGSIEVGTLFKADVNGYITGLRFFKPTGSSESTHQITLWSATGSSLGSATSSSETSSGWQTVNFSSPIPISGGSLYKVSYWTSFGAYYADSFFQNQNLTRGHLTAPGTYSAGSGGCNTDKQWPKNWVGHTSVGIIGCGYVSSGSIVYLENANARTSSISNDLSGCNCIIAGTGPGPWDIENNFFSTTGNGFHHDEGGIAIADDAGARRSTAFWERGDYLYRRNTFQVPLSHMAAQPGPLVPAGDASKGARNPDYDDAYDPTLHALSNGAYYEHRQPLEWKSGHRIKLLGNVFDGMFNNTASSVFVAFTSVCDEGIKDVWISYNTFQHGPGVMVLSSTSKGCMQPPPVSRFLFANNLIWDIRTSYFSPGGPQNPGAGHVLQQLGYEDATIQHNSIIFNKGRAPALTLANFKVEGVKITDNILYFTSANGGVGVRGDPASLFSGPDTCGASVAPDGLQKSNCSFGVGAISKNLLFSDLDHATFIGNWNDGKNYIPPTPSDLTYAKFYDLSSFWNSSFATSYTPPAAPFATPNFRLQATSPNISGGSQKASDGKSMGVNLDQLAIEQGKVTLNGTPTANLTRTSAIVSFVAPDSQACSVDWRVLDDVADPNLTVAFTRVVDPTVKGRVHNVTLTGLPPASTIKYRVNCQVEQPKGKFRTKT